MAPSRFLLLSFVLLLLWSSVSSAETVNVRYRGLVDLRPFECQLTPQSSFVNRVCYDRKNTYMLIQLSGIFYHYCEIPAGLVDQLLKAHSTGGFFNARIKGNFDCRINRVPNY